jgi:acyl carrier protein
MAITDQVLTIVSDNLGLGNTPFKLDDTFQELGADSLDLIEILMSIEEEFEIEIDDYVFEIEIDDYVENFTELQTTAGTIDFVKYMLDKQIKHANRAEIKAYLKTKEKKMTVTTDKKKPANHHKKWTEEDRSQAVLQYAAGTPIGIIAKNLGRTKVAILHQLSEFGLVQFDKDDNAYYTVPALLYQF